ncbi:MAG: alginate lyase family protein [Planctomycetota bacterium]
MSQSVLEPTLPVRRSVLSALRRGFPEGSESDPNALLVSDAEWLAACDPPTVIAKPADVPRPTEDLRDYVSIGTYWWPNPDTPDGLPYVHRDGEFSPQITKYDRPRWDLHSEGLVRMHLAAGLVDHHRYTDAIERWLDVWYVNPDTAMNPHLRHAQMCPGLDKGRAVGCIDFNVRGAHFVDALDDILDAYPAVAPGVRDWWSRMFRWLTEPELRSWHEAMPNNIGVHYDGTIARLAMFVGDDATADRVLEEALWRRVDPQIDPAGKMPEELRRTRSFSYTLMNLAGFLDLACLADARGRDLFDAKSESGRSIASAVDWVWTLAAGVGDWPCEQIGGVHWDSLVRLWWCIPADHRKRYPLPDLAHRLDPDLVADPRRVMPDLLMHPFHQPVWREYVGCFDT